MKELITRKRRRILWHPHTSLVVSNQRIVGAVKRAVNQRCNLLSSVVHSREDDDRYKSRGICMYASNAMREDKEMSDHKQLHRDNKRLDGMYRDYKSSWNNKGKTLNLPWEKHWVQLMIMIMIMMMIQYSLIDRVNKGKQTNVVHHLTSWEDTASQDEKNKNIMWNWVITNHSSSCYPSTSRFSRDKEIRSVTWDLLIIIIMNKYWTRNLWNLWRWMWAEKCAHNIIRTLYCNLSIVTLLSSPFMSTLSLIQCTHEMKDIDRK